MGILRTVSKIVIVSFKQSSVSTHMAIAQSDNRLTYRVYQTRVPLVELI